MSDAESERIDEFLKTLANVVQISEDILLLPSGMRCDRKWAVDSLENILGGVFGNRKIIQPPDFAEAFNKVIEWAYKRAHLEGASQ